MSPKDCETSQDDAEKGQTEKSSKLQRKMQDQLIAYAQARTDRKLMELMTKVDESGVNVSQETIEALAKKLGDKDVEALLQLTKDISQKGFTAVIAGRLVSTLATKLGADASAQVAGDTVTKAVPVAGWIVFASGLVSLGGAIGNIVQFSGYANNVATSVELYEAYNTANSEYKAGETDAAMFGVLNEALSKNMSGSSQDQVPMDMAPVYKDVMGSPTSYLSSIFGSASAISQTPDPQYICNGDPPKPVPVGEKVCPEERFDQDGNGVASSISTMFNSVPLLVPAANLISSVADFITKPIGWIFSLPLLRSVANWFTNVLGLDNLLTFIQEKLTIPATSPNMSGARIFDLMTAGAHAADNCQETLGCPSSDSRSMGLIEQNYENEQKQKFDSMPIFARMFDTSSPYSLISKISLSLPSSTISRMRNIGGMFLDPLSIIFKSGANIFSPKQALAANDTVSDRDPFGIRYNAYSSSDIPSDPETFWQNNCIEGPYGISNPNDNTGTSLDISPWINNDKKYPISTGKLIDFAPNGDNTEMDSSTGQTVYLKPNPCLLIRSTIQSAGAMFDNGLATAGAQ